MNFNKLQQTILNSCLKESGRMIRIQDIIKITKICSTNCGSSPYKCIFDLKKIFNGQFISMKHICLLCNPSIYLSLYHKDNKDLNWRRTNSNRENYFISSLCNQKIKDRGYKSTYTIFIFCKTANNSTYFVT